MTKMSPGTQDSFLAIKCKACDELPELNISKAAKKDSKAIPLKVHYNGKMTGQIYPWADKVDSEGQVKAICLWCKAAKTNSTA